MAGWLNASSVPSRLQERWAVRINQRGLEYASRMRSCGPSLVFAEVTRGGVMIGWGLRAAEGGVVRE